MTNSSTTFTDSPEDYISSTAIFGGIKKTIISKDFKGGKICNIFGETVLDFTYADIKGVAVLDIFQALGETKIIVPGGWRVQADQTLLLATFEDKRPGDFQNIDANKVLIITGTSLLANIVTRSLV